VPAELYSTNNWRVTCSGASPWHTLQQLQKKALSLDISSSNSSSDSSGSSSSSSSSNRKKQVMAYNSAAGAHLTAQRFHSTAAGDTTAAARCLLPAAELITVSLIL
jgi:hypothetical protein